MSGLVLAELEARMESGEPFTYAQLCALSTLHGGNENRDRLADKTIQRWRRKGRISFTREGRSTVWRLVPSHGREGAE